MGNCLKLPGHNRSSITGTINVCIQNPSGCNNSNNPTNNIQFDSLHESGLVGAAGNKINNNNNNVPVGASNSGAVVSLPNTTSPQGALQVASVRVRALYNYTIHNPGDLAFNKGDIMVVSSDLNEPWWFATHQSNNFQTGYIPSNYVVIDDGSPTSHEAWFDINHAEADRKLLLMGYPRGTFIIRPSSDARHCALSIRHFDPNRNFYVVKHYKIRSLDNGGYYISHRTQFDDIRNLISHYTHHSDGLCCRLSEPFPRQHRPPIQFREIEVNRNCINLEKKLGSGSFGDVFLGKWNNSVEVAVKMMRPNCMDRDKFIEEAKLMHQLHHPRIVQILGVCTEPADEPAYIITELMHKGALLNFLREGEGRNLELKDMLLMISQIADGMCYLETKSFVHRDLRAANILVSEDISVKVADFGLARVTEDEYMADPGTKFPIKWTAPEAGLHRVFSVKSDVWSFGVLIYEIVTFGRTPYAGHQNRVVLDEVSNGFRLPNPDGGNVKCPLELYSIMLTCWDANPERRPTFSHLKELFENYHIATEHQYGLNG